MFDNSDKSSVDPRLPSTLKNQVLEKFDFQIY